MSSRIELTLSPSALTGVLASLPWLVLFAFALVTAVTGQPWLLMVGLPALGGAVWQYRQTGLLKAARSVIRLRVEQGQLYAQTRDGRQVAVAPAASSRLGARLSLLKLRCTGTRFGSYHALLLANTPGAPGNVPEDDFRRLRVWLRLGRAGERTY